MSATRTAALGGLATPPRLNNEENERLDLEVNHGKNLHVEGPGCKEERISPAFIAVLGKCFQVEDLT